RHSHLYSSFLLVEHLLFKLNQEFGRQVSKVDGKAMEILVNYHWPGNVRELENFLGRAMINMKPQETVLKTGKIFK
ncbi:MAG: hypothetical protein PWQ31_869, partial [Eubacteriales bacterium]|nr:hypothetical protein [Eubacteriales bacterium]